MENKEHMPVGIFLFGAAIVGDADLMRWKGII